MAAMIENIIDQKSIVKPSSVDRSIIFFKVFYQAADQKIPENKNRDLDDDRVENYPPN